MSRLERLKYRIKNISKAILSFLVITLLIGSTHALPVYAWFTSKGNVDSGLELITGTMGIAVGNGFNIIDTNSGTEITNTFDITNIGSIKQILSINFDLQQNDLSPGLLEKIKYKLELKYENDTINSINGNISELLNSNIDIKRKDGSQFILGPKKSINCVATIYIDHPQVSEALKGKLLEFNLNVKANQINLKDKGFMATYSQSNKISIKEENLEPDEVEGVWGKCKCCGLPGLIFDYPEELKGKEVYINLPFENGNEAFSAHYNYDTGKIVLVKRDEYNYPIKESDVLGKEFIVDFNIPKDKPGYDRYLLVFEKNNSGKIVGKWTFKEYIKDYVNANDSKDINASDLEKEESQGQGKQEVVEPSKDDVVVPNEPDALEPPKQEEETQSEKEIIEMPKEEVVLPSKPDITEPSKEGMEIQE